MRLLTLNIWEGMLRHPLRLLFQAERPDVACLQEVCDSTPGHDWIRPGLIQFRKITGLPHAAFAPAFRQGFMRGRMQFGNAILTNRPILREETTWVHRSFDPDYDLNDAEVPRNFHHAELPGPLHILNYHGHRVRDSHKDGGPEADHACRAIAAYAASLDGEVIIAGDFNLWPSAPALKYLRTGFRDLGKEAGVTNTRTWLKGRDEVSDYVFASNGIEIAGFHVSKHVASDHAALVVDFTTKKDRRTP